MPNLMPVMNLFLTIVPILMLMLVGTQVALLSLNLNQAARVGNQPATVKLSVIIHAAGSIAFEIIQPERKNNVIPKDNGSYDYAKLKQEIQSLKSGYNESSEINIVPNPNVSYDDLIKTIDICRSEGFRNVHYRPMP